MKKSLFVPAFSTVIAATASTVIAHAGTLPACTVYNSNATVPVSAQCDPYYVNGTLVFNAIEVNPGH